MSRVSGERYWRPPSQHDQEILARRIRERESGVRRIGGAALGSLAEITPIPLPFAPLWAVGDAVTLLEAFVGHTVDGLQLTRREKIACVVGAINTNTSCETFCRTNKKSRRNRI